MEEFDKIFNKMDAFLERLFDCSLIHYLPYTTHWKPAMNLYETGNSFWVVLEIPGTEKKNISVRVESGKLIIEGVRPLSIPDSVSHVHNLEIMRGPFRRTLYIKDIPVSEDIRANYRQGLLIIELPKKGTST